MAAHFCGLLKICLQEFILSAQLGQRPRWVNDSVFVLLHSIVITLQFFPLSHSQWPWKRVTISRCKLTLKLNRNTFGKFVAKPWSLLLLWFLVITLWRQGNKQNKMAWIIWPWVFSRHVIGPEIIFQWRLRVLKYFLLFHLNMRRHSEMWLQISVQLRSLAVLLELEHVSPKTVHLFQHP